MGLDGKSMGVRDNFISSSQASTPGASLFHHCYPQHAKSYLYDGTPPIRRNRHQVAAWAFFPNSGRRRDFCLYFFYSEPRLNSSRCKHLLTPLNHPVALTRARLLSSDLPTVSSCASPLDIVAGPFQPFSDLPDLSSTLVDLQVCSSAL